MTTIKNIEGSFNLWRLEAWDGGDRTVPTGIYTSNENVKNEWCLNHLQSATHIEGILVDSYVDIDKSRENVLRQRVLSKLSKRERELLGLENIK